MVAENGIHVTVDDVSTVELIAGVLSCIGSMSVILTLVVFPKLRSLLYMRLVLYVSIGDLIASVSMAFGHVNDGSPECWFQAIGSNYGYLCSAFWVTVITYQVWLIVCRNSILSDWVYTHLTCWVVPLAITLMPLSTNKFGNMDDEASWCSVVNRSDSPSWSLVFWNVVSFFGFLWIPVLATVALLGLIVKHIRSIQVEVPAITISAIRKLCLYPIVLVLCWSIATITSFDEIVSGRPLGSSTSSSELVGVIGIGLVVLQGFFNSAIFFVMNPIVRWYWSILLSNSTGMVWYFCCYRLFFCDKADHSNQDGPGPNHSTLNTRLTDMTEQEGVRSTVSNAMVNSSQGYSYGDEGVPNIAAEPDFVMLSTKPQASLHQRRTHGSESGGNRSSLLSILFSSNSNINSSGTSNNVTNNQATGNRRTNTLVSEMANRNTLTAATHSEGNIC